MKMFKGKDEGIELPKNEYVKLAHLFLKVGFFFFGTTLVVLLVVIVVVPLIAGAMKKGPAYIAYLQGVSSYEERLAANHAGIYLPAEQPKSYHLPPRQAGDGEPALNVGAQPEHDEEIPNPYATSTHVNAARSLVDHIISEKYINDQRGVIVRRDTDQTDSKAIHDKAQNNGTVSEVAQIHMWLNEHVDDNTFAVMREMLIIWVSRMSATLSTILCFIPLVIVAFFLGEAKARLLEEEGNMPMAERSKMFSRFIYFLPPLVTTLPAIPLAWNILMIIPFIMVAFIIVIFYFRANFIEI